MTTFGVKLSLNDVRPTPDGQWVVTRCVAGQDIEFTGPNRGQVLEQAQAHFDRVLNHHNRQLGEETGAQSCA